MVCHFPGRWSCCLLHQLECIFIIPVSKARSWIMGFNSFTPISFSWHGLAYTCIMCIQCIYKSKFELLKFAVCLSCLWSYKNLTFLPHIQYTWYIAHAWVTIKSTVLCDGNSCVVWNMPYKSIIHVLLLLSEWCQFRYCKSVCILDLCLF